MKNYFVYLPKDPVNSIWSGVTTSVGFTNIPPRTPYPPQQHPMDHYFDWGKGRVLQTYQIILISAGRGIFESATLKGTRPVEAGTVLILFPGIWHRYRPDPVTGWVEHWIECRGPAFDEAVRVGLIDPEKCVLRQGLTRDLQDCFERCHSLAGVDAVANQDLLSTLGLHLLALLGHLRRSDRGFTKAIDAVVHRALMLIALRCQEPLNLQALAKELGVGYSHLRHSFMARTGISPREHYLNTRTQKAQDLLVNTTKSVKEISEILGFDSASHFSKQFKKRVGVSPLMWRETYFQEPRTSI